MAFLTKCLGGGKELLPCKKLMLMRRFVGSRLNDGDDVNLYRATNIYKKAMLGQSLCQNNKERYMNRGRRKKDEKKKQRMIYVWPVTSQSCLLENPSVSSTVGLTWVCSVFILFFLQVVNATSLEAFLAGNITATTTSEGQTTLPTTTIIQASELPLEQVAASDSTTVITTDGVPASSADVELGSNYVMCVQNMKTERIENEGSTAAVAPERLPESSTNIQTISGSASQEPSHKRQKVN